MNTYAGLLVALPLVASLVACDGLSSSCTEIGCADAYDIEFRSASGSWPAGSYEIAVTADGVDIACTSALPFTSASNPEGSCSSPDVLLGLSGSALPASEHALAGLTFLNNPKKVKVVITRDGAPFASRELTPAYKTSMPNGPDCEPVCKSANDTMSVP